MAEGKTFWGHVEVFRWLLIRCAVVVFGLAVAAFCYKEFVFEGIILAPCDADFITYRLLSKIGLVAQVGQIELININLAYPQLQRGDFKADLSRIVEELDYPAKNLKLELTERCKLLNMSLLLELMIFFNTSGYQTALDDFGTGYSALNLMTDLPITQIKIDRSYILNVENDPAKQSLLKAIVGCASELGKGVCVEGVENAQMRDFLLAHYPITNIQGYYYSKPLPFDELVEWIRFYDRNLEKQY